MCFRLQIWFRNRISQLKFPKPSSMHWENEKCYFLRFFQNFSKTYKVGKAEIMTFWNSFRLAIQRYQQWRARLIGKLMKDQNVLPTLPEFGQLSFRYGSSREKNFQILWLRIPRATCWYIIQSIASPLSQRNEQKCGVYPPDRKFLDWIWVQKNADISTGTYRDLTQALLNSGQNSARIRQMIWSRNNFDIFSDVESQMDSLLRCRRPQLYYSTAT